MNRMLLIGGLLVATLGDVAQAEPLPLCASERVNCIVDGDTFFLDGETIRLDGIDAPDLRARPACFAEAEIALAAAKRLAELLGEAGATTPDATNPDIPNPGIIVTRNGTDSSGRTLARVTAGGWDVGDALIAAGLARPSTEATEDWCG